MAFSVHRSSSLIFSTFILNPFIFKASRSFVALIARFLLLSLLVLLGHQCLLPVQLKAQPSRQQTRQWCFGYGARVTFPNGGGPASPAASSTPMLVQEASVSVADSAGNLLFFSSGDSIWDRNAQVMPNGGGLLGDRTRSQPVLAVPHPDPALSQRWFVFYLTAVGDTTALRYSLVDMSLRGGLGDVVGGGRNLPVPSLGAALGYTGKLTASKACSGRDYWIWLHKAGSAEFVRIPLTATGPGLPVTQTIGSPHNSSFTAGIPAAASRGYMKCSPDGRAMALVLGGPNASNLIEYLRIDPATGVLSNPITLPALGGEHGVAFSPDNAKLFVAGARDSIENGVAGLFNHLRAFDLMSRLPVPPASVVRQAWQAGSRGYNALQNGPDGRIYLSQTFTDYLHALQSPNTPFYAYTDSLVGPIGGTTRKGLPNFSEESFSLPFRAHFVSTVLCYAYPVQFFDSSLFHATSFSWSFGDPASGALNSSTLRDPQHSFATPGNYTVRLVAGFGCGRSDTATRIIRVSDTLDLALGNAATLNSGGADTLYYCLGDTATLISRAPGGSFIWSFRQPGGTWQSLPNTTAQLQTTTAGWYRLTVSGISCTATDSVFVTFDFLPILIGDAYSVAQGIRIDTLTYCVGDTARLTSDVLPPARYRWQAGQPGGPWITMGSSQTYATTNPGWYRFLTDKDGCRGSDSLFLQFSNVVLQLGDSNSLALGGRDSLFYCGGDTALLRTNVLAGGYVWYTGQPGGPWQVIPGSSFPRAVWQTGWYKVTAQGGACAGSDSVYVEFLNLNFQVGDAVSLPLGGRDTLVYCFGDTAFLHGTLNPGSFRWSYRQGVGGNWAPLPDTGFYLPVTLPGWYLLQASRHGCVFLDSVFVFYTPVGIPVDLGADVLLCSGDSILLDAGAPGSNYLWSDGSRGRQLRVRSPGVYWVSVFLRSCTGSDTIIIREDPLAIGDVLRDTTICPGQDLWFDMTGLGVNYLWSNGSTDPIFRVQTAGRYSVRIINANGCSRSDTFDVEEFCATRYEIPNVFRPSSSVTENRVFRPIVLFSDSTRYLFQVYDRYGACIFSSGRPEQGWDGTYAGSPCTDGQYTYMLQFYDNRLRRVLRRSAYFWLLR
jgi:gliding motility-associated-like protein